MSRSCFAPAFCCALHAGALRGRPHTRPWVSSRLPWFPVSRDSKAWTCTDRHVVQPVPTNSSLGSLLSIRAMIFKHAVSAIQIESASKEQGGNQDLGARNRNR